MEAAGYLLLGLAVVGAMVYALLQVNARQQRLHAELTRLERLTAEVTMNAEAVLEQVDQRIERLNQLVATLEARAQRASHGVPAEAPNPPEPTADGAPPKSQEQTPAGAGRAAARGGKPRKQAAAAYAPAAQATAAAQAPEVQEEQPPADRYADRRQAVYALADQGKSPLEIAEALSIPRGEVQLLLNLRGRKVPRS